MKERAKKMQNMTFDIAVANSRQAKFWKNRTVTWQELLRKIEHPVETEETYEEYLAMDKSKQDAIKDKGGFVGGMLREGRRKKGYVAYRQLMCLDMDYGTLEFWKQYPLLFDYTCCIYSTHKHSSKMPRYRLIFPLSRGVTEEEYEAAGRKLAQRLGMELFDDTTYEAARLMYWPTKSKGAEYFADHYEGRLVEVDELLNTYNNWKDCREWPRSMRAKPARGHEPKLLENPVEKEGIIGDFCRAYSITEAIETFLPSVYSPCEEMGPNRYTYMKGSSSGGAVVYDNQFLHSHHATDPACGGSHNSFDLVRIHLFGKLDELAKNSSDTLPSMKAMIAFAQEDEKVIAQNKKSVLKAFGEDRPAEELPNITYYSQKGGKCLDAYKLAQYIRQHCAYLIVRKRGYDSEFLYWYEEGYYSLIGTNEFKGKIKAFIPAELCKPHAWEEVYKHLMTDVATTDFEELNSCEDYINFKNGIYNVKTKELEPHSKDLICSVQLKADYNSNAPEPKVWLEFINRLGNYDESQVAILQEWVGLTLSNIYGYRCKKCLALVSKIGNTGKTQFNNVLGDIIGNEHICSTPIQKFEKSFGLGSIYGAKAILIDDQTRTAVEDSSHFKQITGGGKVDCEIKGKQSFPYIFKGTLTFGCNDLPYFKGDKGDHLFDRIMIVMCDKVLEEHERNASIREEMFKEREGIVKWALIGLHRLIEQDFIFTYSKASSEALKEYRGMNDSLYRYISEHYEVTKREQDRIAKAELEQHYHIWCLDNEIEPVRKKNVKERAAKQGILLIRSNGMYYTGLKALNPK